MRTRPFAMLLALLAGAALPAAAGEVIYFTNGTTMEASSVEYEDDMIHVFLDADAKLAFPRYLVERVETDDSQKAGIRGRGSRGRRSTRSNATSAGGNAAARPQTTRPASNSEVRGKVEVDDNGIVTERPFANSNHPGKRQLRLTGSEAARNGAQVGNRTRNGRAGAGAGRRVLPSHRGRQREAMKGPEIKSFEFDPKPRGDGKPANSNSNPQQNDSQQDAGDN